MAVGVKLGVDSYRPPVTPTFPHTARGQHGSGHAVCRTRPPVRQGLHQAREKMHKTRQERISEDRYGHSDWVRHHGLYWILRQTHPHPNQQHHRWWLNQRHF
ncbi:hypothetical protein AMELA_G00221670 [Ameiurus melas]|uniref:Uncharacterized protein n=1 Tax=Ameiurus melas TaxID=219545 RepID=A0A7J6A0F6_AMEME|nr:hypothetical protein AMELA_G00221670 [Ameiurus melas]